MTDADSQDPSIGHPRSSKHTALTRRTARLNAVQALYQMEITGQGLDYVIETFTHQGSLGELDGQITVWDPAMFRTLLTAAVHHQTETDRLTGSVLRQDWTLASIDPTLRAIFRAAGAELHNPERTPRIVIRRAGLYRPAARSVGFSPLHRLHHRLLVRAPSDRWCWPFPGLAFFAAIGTVGILLHMLIVDPWPGHSCAPSRVSASPGVSPSSRPGCRPRSATGTGLSASIESWISPRAGWPSF